MCAGVRFPLYQEPNARTRHMLFLAALLPTFAGQGSDPGRQNIEMQFSLSHSDCGYSHDPVLEKALHVAIRTDPPQPPKKTSVLELRNDSAKTITAYVLTSTRMRNGSTDRFGAEGVHSVQEVALRMQYTRGPDLSSRAILHPPERVLERQISRAFRGLPVPRGIRGRDVLLVPASYAIDYQEPAILRPEARPAHRRTRSCARIR